MQIGVLPVGIDTLSGGKGGRSPCFFVGEKESNIYGKGKALHFDLQINSLIIAH